MRAGAALEPGDDELVVVVARHEHDLAAAHGGPDLAEERLARSQRLADRAVAQLEDVAEEHEAVGAVQRLEQRRAHLGLAQDVGAGAPAEVQVGDDQRDRHAA